MSSEGATDVHEVLFVHGAGLGGWMWAPVLHCLDAAVRPIVPDLPGFGGTTTTYVSHDATVAELADTIRAATTRPVLVVGFSLGTQLAILLACRHPDLVCGVVAVSGEALPMRWPSVTLGLVSLTAPLARSRGFARAQARQLSVPAPLVEDYLLGSTTISRGTLAASVGDNIRFRLPDEWSAVRIPVTVLVGSRERRLMRRSARVVADAVPGSTLRVVEGAGHDIPFTRPETVAAAIVAMLAAQGHPNHEE